MIDNTSVDREDAEAVAEGRGYVVLQHFAIDSGQKSFPIPLDRHLRDLRSASLNYADDRLLVANGSLSLLDRQVSLI